MRDVNERVRAMDEDEKRIPEYSYDVDIRNGWYKRKYIYNNAIVDIKYYDKNTDTLYTEKEYAQLIWDILEDIPIAIDDDGLETLDVCFPLYPYWERDTEKEEVWHNIEELFHVSIVDDLM